MKLSSSKPCHDSSLPTLAITLNCRKAAHNGAFTDSSIRSSIRKPLREQQNRDIPELLKHSQKRHVAFSLPCQFCARVRSPHIGTSECFVVFQLQTTVFCCAPFAIDVQGCRTAAEPQGPGYRDVVGSI